MADIIQMVSTLAPAVAWIVKGYVSSPVLGLSKEELATMTSAAMTAATALSAGITPAGGVLIEAETYKEIFRSDISTSLILNLAEGKDYISDNIVPHPREWKITGYVPGTKLELSGLLMPSLRAKRILLVNMQKSRQIVWFKTRDFEFVQVGIAAMELDTRADVSNKIPIDITLQEVVSLSTQRITSAAAALPQNGGADGLPIQKGFTDSSTQLRSAG